MIQEIKNNIIAENDEIKDGFELLDDIYYFFYSDKESFKALYDSYLPKITEENFDELVVFSHNDI